MVEEQLAAGVNSASQSCLSLIALPEFEALRHRLAEGSERRLIQRLGASLKEFSLGGDSAARLTPDRYGLVHSADADLERLSEEIAALTREVDPLNIGLVARSTTLDLPASGLDETAVSGIRFAVNRFAVGDNGAALPAHEISTLAQLAMHAANSWHDLIAYDRFDMVLQPIVDARSGVIHHYEALARFPGDSILPQERIAFAEAAGIVADFDAAMAQRAVDWLRKETGVNSRVRVAVNVSGQSVNSLAYLASIELLLRNNSWARGRLLFEITETSRINDLQAANAFVQRLKQLGAQVCLDDLGAGAANFRYLSSLEVDIVKLDGDAVRTAISGLKGKAFMKALVSLCRELGVKTVAEMVETEALLHFTRECGFDLVQGYLFGRPSPDIRAFARSIPGGLFVASC